MTMGSKLHQGQRVLTHGAPLGEASAAMIMVHGRGATAESILELAAEFGQEGICFLAPQAAGYTWYPNSFLAPTASNEPWLSSALAAMEDICARVDEEGPGLDRSLLLGFSQGACLALEYVARHARRFGAVVGFSGGLIGPEGTPRDYPGSLEGTRVFLGSSDPDPHVPPGRVRETAQVLTRMGAEVTIRIYPSLGHTINQDEIDAANQLLSAIPRDR